MSTKDTSFHSFFAFFSLLEKTETLDKKDCKEFVVTWSKGELSQPSRRRNIFGKGGKFLTDGIVIVVVISNQASEIEMLIGNNSQK